MKQENKTVSLEFVYDNILSDRTTALLYLQEALLEGDDDFFAKALGNVIRANPKGMQEVAKASGQSRESLYKSLSGKTKPKFVTISKVLKAIGYEITLSPVKDEVFA